MLTTQLITVFTIVLSLHYTKAKLNTPLNRNETQGQILNCAVDIANNNFIYRQVTVLLYKDVDDKLVNKFLMSYKGSVIVDTKREGTPTTQVVVIVESFQSFMKILTKLKPDLKGKSLMNNGAKFLILILLENKNKIDRINSILWSFYVTDVVIVTKDIKNRILMYTYYPYKSHLNCQNTEPTLIGYWNNSTALSYERPNKMNDMKECPIYISTNKIKYPLTERKIPLEHVKKAIIRLFRDIMNYTPISSVKDYISFDSDRARNWSDSLSDVLTGVANISTSTIPVGVDRLGLLDYSMPYSQMRLIWLAPPVTPGPVWWRLLSPLNGYLWLVLLFVIFIVKSLPFIMKLRPIKRFCTKYFKDSNKLQSVEFRIWGILVGQPVRVSPRKFRDFYILGLWMWFTFVIRNVYQSVLIGALKTDSMMGNFADLNEVVAAGYNFGGRAGIYAHFEYDSLIQERYQIVDELDFERVFLNVIEGRQKFVLATSLEYAFAYCVAQGKNEKDCGHILPDLIMSVPLVVWMRKHSPFQRSFSMWLPRLIESGLLQRRALMGTAYCCLVSSDPTPLTNHQVMSCFLCLMLGYVICSIIFLLEIFKFRLEVYALEKRRPFRH